MVRVVCVASVVCVVCVAVAVAVCVAGTSTTQRPDAHTVPTALLLERCIGGGDAGKARRWQHQTQDKGYGARRAPWKAVGVGGRRHD